MNLLRGPFIKSFLVVLSFVSLPLVISAQEVKDPNPPANVPDGPVSIMATGGPDAFGYTFADENEPDCAFQFVDISSTGTFIFEGDDAASGPVSLGGPINIYGEVFTELNMATNGYITTDPTDTGTDLSNDCPLPSPLSTGGGARLYPLHDDLDLEPGIGRGLVQYFPECPRPSSTCGLEDCTIFYYDNVSHFPGGILVATWDMEVILYHQSNDIVYQIGPGNPEQGAGSTTGIQNFPPPTTGLTYACNTAGSVPDNTAVCIFHPEPECLVPPPPPPVSNIPTLSEWGMLAMAVLLGVVGLAIARRRLSAQ